MKIVIPAENKRVEAMIRHMSYGCKMVSHVHAINLTSALNVNMTKERWGYTPTLLTCVTGAAVRFLCERLAWPESLCYEVKGDRYDWSNCQGSEYKDIDGIFVYLGVVTAENEACLKQARLIAERKRYRDIFVRCHPNMKVPLNKISKDYGLECCLGEGNAGRKMVIVTAISSSMAVELLARHEVSNIYLCASKSGRYPDPLEQFTGEKTLISDGERDDESYREMQLEQMERAKVEIRRCIELNKDKKEIWDA